MCSFCRSPKVPLESTKLWIRKWPIRCVDRNSLARQVSIWRLSFVKKVVGVFGSMLRRLKGAPLWTLAFFWGLLCVCVCSCSPSFTSGSSCCSPSCALVLKFIGVGFGLKLFCFLSCCASHASCTPIVVVISLLCFSRRAVTSPVSCFMSWFVISRLCS